jgi:hypothetical protein
VVSGSFAQKRIAMESVEDATVNTLCSSKENVGTDGSLDLAEALFKNHVLASTELCDSFNWFGFFKMQFFYGNSIGLVRVTALAETVTSTTRIHHLGSGRNDLILCRGSAILH